MLLGVGAVALTFCGISDRDPPVIASDSPVSEVPAGRELGRRDEGGAPASFESCTAPVEPFRDFPSEVLSCSGGEITEPIGSVLPRVRCGDVPGERLSGPVVLEAIVDSKGNVAQVRVKRTLSAAYDEAARSMLAQRRFEPARMGNRPVSVYYTLGIYFLCAEARPPIDPDIPTSELSYARLASEGESLMEARRYEQAMFAFRAALATRFAQVPTFELYGKLALATCRAGGHQTGAQLLKDFTCMLDIASGELPCDADEDASRSSTERPKPTALCRQRMCGEISPPSYESPPAEHLAPVATLRTSLPTIAAACKAGR